MMIKNRLQLGSAVSKFSLMEIPGVETRFSDFFTYIWDVSIQATDQLSLAV